MSPSSSSSSFHLVFSSRLFVHLRQLSSPSPSCSRHARRKQPSLLGTVARSSLLPLLRRGVAGSVVNPLSERMMGLLEECARRRAGGRPAADDADGRILQPSSPRCRRRQDPLYCERRWLIFPIARCCNCFLLPLMTDAAWHCSEKCTKLHLHSAIARDDSGHIRGLRHERPPGPQLGFGTRSGQALILVLPRPS